MPTEKHTILGGEVYVYRRENSRFWQCSTFLHGKKRRVSTKEESFTPAKEFAEDWYLELRGKKARGELKKRESLFPSSATVLAGIRSRYRRATQSVVSH